MINLLPPRARRIVGYEYWARVGAVWGLLVGGAFLLASVFLVPTYVLVHLESTALDQESSTLQEIQANTNSTEAVVWEVDALMRELTRNSDATDFSRIIDAIDETASESITLSRYQMARLSDVSEEESKEISGSEADIATINVEGTASSRESLTAFRDALEAHQFFARAEVPLSDFVQSQDLPFSITLTLADTDE